MQKTATAARGRIRASIIEDGQLVNMLNQRFPDHSVLVEIGDETIKCHIGELDNLIRVLTTLRELQEDEK